MNNKRDTQKITINGKGTLFVDGKVYGTMTEATLEIGSSKFPVEEPEAPLDTENVITVRLWY